MDFQNLIELYNSKKREFGGNTYKYISELLSEAKIIHKEDWVKSKPDGDHKQAWKAFKGSNLEKLIHHIIVDEVQALGLKIISGNSLNKHPKNLSVELQTIKRNLLIDYGELEAHLPDVDIVVYNPKNYSDIIVISVKTTLRDRVAQTAYWKLKLMESPLTEHILVYFITLDEDGVLNDSPSGCKKPRAIVETDVDSCYVLTKADVSTSDRVKTFNKFIDDIKLWFSTKQK